MTSTSLFFFNDTATTEIYTLSLHDALPICSTRIVSIASAARNAASCHPPKLQNLMAAPPLENRTAAAMIFDRGLIDRKSTRLNSSHGYISYAVFCLNKKNSSPLHQASSS